LLTFSSFDFYLLMILMTQNYYRQESRRSELDEWAQLFYQTFFTGFISPATGKTEKKSPEMRFV